MINISPAAEDDLSGIALDIATHRPRIAQRWLETAQETFEMLDRQPDVGEVRIGFGVPGCRSFSHGNYVIFFRRVDSGIEIARVIHASRDLGNL